MATAPIRPLAWYPPYAMDVALKSKKQKKKIKKNKSTEGIESGRELKIVTRNHRFHKIDVINK